MKAAILFDSVYGHTKNVGEMIGDVLKENGWDVETIYLKHVKPHTLDCDLLFIGSPTRIGKATRKTRIFLKSNILDSFSGMVVAFDTILKVDKNDPKAEKMRANYIENGAAPTTKKTLLHQSVRVYDDLLRVEVMGIKGPLVDDAGDTVRTFVEKLLSSFQAES